MDDSNSLMRSKRLNKWFGALPVGIIAHSGGDDDEEEFSLIKKSSEKSARYIGDKAVIVLPRKLEWAGFVLNSRLLWRDADDKPEWVKDLDTVTEAGEDIESPLSLLKDYILPWWSHLIGSYGRWKGSQQIPCQEMHAVPNWLSSGKTCTKTKDQNSVAGPSLGEGQTVELLVGTRIRSTTI